MKKLILAAVFCMTMAVSAFAQPGGGQQMSAEDRAKQSSETLAKRLTLSDEVKAKVYAIQLERINKMNEFRSKNQGDRDAMMAEMQKQTAETDKKIEALLTDDQKKEYAKMKEEQRQRMQNRQGGGGNN